MEGRREGGTLSTAGVGASTIKEAEIRCLKTAVQETIVECFSILGNYRFPRVPGKLGHDPQTTQK